ncbi:MAG: non-hydrolyzing UDP-N-acetylglucosamine 2-epimerase [Ilumatobacteraceae bacterium]
MVHVLCVAGARPNFMKVKPVIDALEQRGVQVTLVHTGQHYDPAMSDVFFDELGIRSPDVHLGVGSGTHAEQTARVMIGFEAVVEERNPDWVVVAGDVNSTLACALVGAKAGTFVAHVEAGLRSRDWSMPEEVNRVVTDRVSDLLFAPSADAVDNLRAEGYRSDQIVLAGNVMVDTLLSNLERALARPILSELGLTAKGYGVVTLHRPANVDDPQILRQLLAALGEISQTCPLLLPVHPRAAEQLTAIGVPAGLRLIPPAGYLDFVALQNGARVVLTDSGGVQEETTVLGVPCVTLRDNTERPITVSEGTNHIAGREPSRIVEVTRSVLAHPSPARRPPLWDGHAADRIADAIVRHSARPACLRPTGRAPRAG